MAYYIDLFSAETKDAFIRSNKNISGFRVRQRGIAEEIKPGDKFICYVTRISRWFGILEVTSKYFEDNAPIFYSSNDPFIIRFNVKPIVWLPLENSIPIFDDIVWKHLSFTKDIDKRNRIWTSMVRGSLRKLDEADGKYLDQLLTKQKTSLEIFPITEDDSKKLKTPTVKTVDSKELAVSIPENDISTEIDLNETTVRDSIRIQALLAEIGERMNLKIWLPRSDRGRVQSIWKSKQGSLLESLPLNYDDTTLRTIENIDVLWVRGRSIVRAFEVEHTTSIYSGILRMADLMALQPNLRINAHIVAPLERKEKVLEEIKRPVFTLLDKGPLSESCSFISYDSVRELSKEKNLEYMNDLVWEKYEEFSGEEI